MGEMLDGKYYHNVDAIENKLKISLNGKCWQMFPRPFQSHAVDEIQLHEVCRFPDFQQHVIVDRTSLRCYILLFHTLTEPAESRYGAQR